MLAVFIGFIMILSPEEIFVEITNPRVIWKRHWVFMKYSY